jgi:hypothetical protein
MSINVTPFPLSPEVACRLPASFSTDIQAWIQETLEANFSAIVQNNLTVTDTLPGVEDGVVIKTGIPRGLAYWNPVTGQYEMDFPSGAVIWEGKAYGDAVPLGWVLLDGQLHDITDPLYAAIFSRYGYVWGGAGGQFRMPDATTAVQLMSAGAGTNGETPYAAGEKKGDTEATLALNQVTTLTPGPSAGTQGLKLDNVTNNTPDAATSRLEPTLFGRFLMRC